MERKITLDSPEDYDKSGKVRLSFVGDIAAAQPCRKIHSPPYTTLLLLRPRPQASSRGDRIAGGAMNRCRCDPIPPRRFSDR